MRQLIFTSALLGLNRTRSGFCTVARHASLRERTVDELEKMSEYDPPPGTRPTVFLFRVYSAGNEPLFILSRAGDAGKDAFGRANYVVHHLIFQKEELDALPPPAEVALRFRGWCKKFVGKPHFLPENEALPPEILRREGEKFVPAKRWKELTGDAGNAALLAPYGEARATIFVGDESMNEVALGLFAESAETLGRRDAWTVAFATGICSRKNAGRFLWRMVGARELAVRHPGDFILDFLAPLSVLRPPKTVFAEYARTGEFPASAMPKKISMPGVAAAATGMPGVAAAATGTVAFETKRTDGAPDATGKPKLKLAARNALDGNAVKTAGAEKSVGNVANASSAANAVEAAAKTPGKAETPGATDATDAAGADDAENLSEIDLGLDGAELPPNADSATQKKVAIPRISRRLLRMRRKRFFAAAGTLAFVLISAIVAASILIILSVFDTAGEKISARRKNAAAAQVAAANVAPESASAEKSAAANAVPAPAAAKKNAEPASAAPRKSVVADSTRAAAAASANPVSASAAQSSALISPNATETPGESIPPNATETAGPAASANAAGAANSVVATADDSAAGTPASGDEISSGKPSSSSSVAATDESVTASERSSATSARGATNDSVSEKKAIRRFCAVLENRISVGDFAGAAETWIAFSDAFPTEIDRFRTRFLPRFKLRVAEAFADRVGRRLLPLDAGAELSPETCAAIRADLAIFSRVRSALELSDGQIQKKNLAVFERAAAAVAEPAEKSDDAVSAEKSGAAESEMQASSAAEPATVPAAVSAGLPNAVPAEK